MNVIVAIDNISILMQNPLKQGLKQPSTYVSKTPLEVF